MTTWLYLASASTSRASLKDTLETADALHAVWRSARTRDGRARIANVQHLQPGDTLILAFRQPRPRAYLRGRIGRPTNPVPGTSAIDRVGEPYASDLAAAGYPVRDGVTEVIHLENVEPCCFDLIGKYLPQQQTIWSLDREPADVTRTTTSAQIHVPALDQGDPIGRPKNPRSPNPEVQPESSPPHAIPRTPREARCFDAYLMVDWSANSAPASPDTKDSVWLGSGRWRGDAFESETPRHMRTRFEARASLREQLDAWKREGLRVLVGLDFAFGYPRGFASALLPPGSTWRELHARMAATIDTAQNAHSGAEFAAWCNGVIAPRDTPGPFWGCHARDVVAGMLTQRRVGTFSFPYGERALAEWRITDERSRKIATPQSVWKLNCGVSVGMQTIVGIKHLAEMRREFDGSARIWPFETGFTKPTEAEIWFAEIFPSVVPEHPSAMGREPRDLKQVVSCVLEAAHRDAAGAMSATLGKPQQLSEEDLSAVMNEEGWMLFV